MSVYRIIFCAVMFFLATSANAQQHLPIDPVYWGGDGVSKTYNAPLNTKVGVGTTNPIGKLSIDRDTADGDWMTLQDVYGGGFWRFYGPSGDSRLELAHTNADQTQHRWQVLCLGEDGRVGINGLPERGQLNISRLGQGDWLTLSRQSSDGFFRFYDDPSENCMSIFYSESESGTHYWNMLQFGENGTVGINGGLAYAENAEFSVYGEQAITVGHSSWLQLNRRDVGGSWLFHNPASQDRFEIALDDGMGGRYWNLFTIAENGNVGIGIADAPAKLAVDGDILAEEVRVKMSQDWPDYVFQDGYNLLPLATVEKHIASNGSLPGVPSGLAVASNGIELGEMNRIMMEKIEELTLYVIELEKKQQVMQKELQALRK